MLITCKCLNVAIRLGKAKPKGIPVSSLQLTIQESSHLFFAEGVAEIKELVEINKQIPSLTVSQTVGHWTIESCVNCATPFFAQHNEETELSLISSGLISDPNTIQSLKTHVDFSPVFRIVIREEDCAPFLGEHTVDKVQSALSGLEKQLGDVIHKQTIKTEENIRNFSEQQYELLDKFRDRASRDHQSLVRVLRSVERVNAAITTTPTKPIPPASLDNLIRSTPRATSKAIGITSRSMSLFSSRGESVDAQGIFSLEGMDNSPREVALSEGDSDTDHEDSGSHDEGIDVCRKKGSSVHLAKSLPVNVPAFAPPGLKLHPIDLGPHKEAEDPQDIAASIKALARSVHGEALFGDLPRPRFSTQI